MRNKIFSSLTPWLRSTSIACIADPPVAGTAEKQNDESVEELYAKTDSRTQHGIKKKTVSRGNVFGKLGVLKDKSRKRVQVIVHLVLLFAWQDPTYKELWLGGLFVLVDVNAKVVGG